MLEMNYRRANGDAPVVLDFGEYRGIKYVILSWHEYPCCYIGVGVELMGTVSEYCHGGATYSAGHVPWFEEVTRGTHWIGWDYAHSGDYIAFMPALGGKRWTTEDLIAEVKSVIDKVREVMDDDA